MVHTGYNTMTRTIYVNAPSKRYVLTRMDAGFPVFGIVYDGKKESVESIAWQPHGTRVCLRRSIVRPIFTVMIWDALNGTCK